jgi:FkbM family methyltransferase
MSYSYVDCNNIPLDKKLDDILNHKTNGFFIELGANDGLTQSNTAFFEFSRNWKGVLIEPSYNKFLECKNNRPNSECFNFACVSNDYKSSVIEGDFNGSLMASINGERNGSTNLVKAQTITLDKIIESIIPCMPDIDLLSLDAEGYELQILKGLDLKLHRPKYILVEIYEKDYCSIESLLKENGYNLISNFSNYSKLTNTLWDGTHNDYLFVSK